jgi:hypothetical protein
MEDAKRSDDRPSDAGGLCQDDLDASRGEIPGAIGRFPWEGTIGRFPIGRFPWEGKDNKEDKDNKGK